MHRSTSRSWAKGKNNKKKETKVVSIFNRKSRALIKIKKILCFF